MCNLYYITLQVCIEEKKRTHKFLIKLLYQRITDNKSYFMILLDLIPDKCVMRSQIIQNCIIQSAIFCC